MTVLDAMKMQADAAGLGVPTIVVAASSPQELNQTPHMQIGEFDHVSLASRSLACAARLCQSRSASALQACTVVHAGCQVSIDLISSSCASCVQIRLHDFGIRPGNSGLNCNIHAVPMQILLIPAHMAAVSGSTKPRCDIAVGWPCHWKRSAQSAGFISHYRLMHLGPHSCNIAADYVLMLNMAPART